MTSASCPDCAVARHKCTTPHFFPRSDSNGSETGDPGDQPLAGVAITVQWRGVTYSGVTDADGLFRTGWSMNVKSGTYYADAVDLALQDYIWDHSLDLEDDSDSDGKVDGVLYR